MKKIIPLILTLIIFSGCQTTGIVKDTSKYSYFNEKLQCNLHQPISTWKYYLDTIYKKTLFLNPNIDANWYYVQTWGIKDGKKSNYKHGRSFGVCVDREGKGYFYTAEPSGNAKKRSWVNVSYIIGGRGWYPPLKKHDMVPINTKAYNHFPVQVKNIKNLIISSSYNFKGTGSYNHNITLWLTEPGMYPPSVEVMIKFNRTISKTVENFIGKLKTKNHNFSVYTGKGTYNKFRSVDFQDSKQIFSKDGNYNINLNIKEILNFLVEKKIIKEDLILPGIDFTTEIWYGEGKMKVNNLKYKLELK